jgi:hypothetical protein
MSSKPDFIARVTALSLAAGMTLGMGESPYDRLRGHSESLDDIANGMSASRKSRIRGSGHSSGIGHLSRGSRKHRAAKRFARSRGRRMSSGR